MTHRNYDHDIEQIRTALHSDRASVMVGAGFSFNAQKRYASARNFPLWSTLTESLVARLYPGDEKARDHVLKNSGATSGALRLAQEFEAAFGRTVLLNHLRDMLPDREYEPGALHDALLKLPWVDVFTTNYDTLLERGARPLRERRYEVVRCVNDLPLKQRPRIIKLHGTLPELNDCILTEEDYRTYPERFSPLIAEMQVAMVESHLCLVGFSGDDPNFLAWSGWVRDRLRTQTLPIYLWTFSDSTTFQSRMLEQRAVIPLPLRRITGEQEPERALHKFLKRLQEPIGKQLPRWCLPRHLKRESIIAEPLFSKPEATSSEEWFNAALAWRNNRRLYPGWVVPNLEAIEHLWSKTEPWAEHAETNPPELTTLDAPTCVFVQFELLWRMRHAVFPAYDRLATVTWSQLLGRYSEWRGAFESSRVEIGPEARRHSTDIAELDFCAVELYLETLRHAREVGDFERFNSLFDAPPYGNWHISREQSEYVEHFRRYQECLVCLSMWKDDDLTTLLSNWKTDVQPVWALRRAGLAIEIGHRQMAEEILIRALEELRTTADEGTPETWSIESWVVHLLRDLEVVKKKASFPRLNASSLPLRNRGDALHTFEQSTVNTAPRGVDAYGTERTSHVSVDRNAEGNNRSPNWSLELVETLDWLREHHCDPKSTLDWMVDQNSLEFTHSRLTSRIQGFDSRTWTNRIGFDTQTSNKRLLAAYRALRLIEDAGLPLRSENVWLYGRLAEQAIRFLAERDALESTGIVLRMRTSALIQEWFSRYRLATLPYQETQRLTAIAESCVGRLAENPERLILDSVAKRQFEAAIELLSRVVVRADATVLKNLCLFANELPIKLKIWERPQLVDDLAVLMRRICDGLSTPACYEILPEILETAVPGSAAYPELPGDIEWDDPVAFLDRRASLLPLQRSEKLMNAISAVIRRVFECTDNPASLRLSERQYLIQRLVTLADRGMLSGEQQHEFARALFAVRDDLTGFPAGTGCRDSVVLLAPPFEGVNEHGLFASKYINAEWPTDFGKLQSLLMSLAGTGPVIGCDRGCRMRGVAWSSMEMREIARRCCAAVLRQRQILDCEEDIVLESNPMRKMFPNDKDRARVIIDRVADVVDSVLLQQESVSNAIWGFVVKTVEHASNAGHPLLLAYPKLASFDSRYTVNLVEEICTRLSSKDFSRVQNGLLSVNRWANQLMDSRIPKIPDVILACINGNLEGEYSSCLIHILDTCGNLLRRLPQNDGKRLLERCESAIQRWSLRLAYGTAGRLHEFIPEMRAEIPDLRASMTRLCVAAQSKELSSETTSRWLEAVRGDPMPEIRRALIEHAT